MAHAGRRRERALTLSEMEREELPAASPGRSPRPTGSSDRPGSFLASADGEANVSIAHPFGISNPTLCHWRKKWFEQGRVGLYGEARSGRPRTYDKDRVAGLLRTVLQKKPSEGTLDGSLRRLRDRPLEEHRRPDALALRRVSMAPGFSSEVAPENSPVWRAGDQP